MIFADASVYPMLAGIRDKIPTVKHIVIMKDTPDAAVPDGLPGVRGAARRRRRRSTQWPQLAETDALGMCYTSGTTGHPKGVVYTHRGIFLHCLAQAAADTMALSENDVILHVVPMFHANAWCVPYGGVMTGATQIFAGPNIQPKDICEIVQAEKVTFVGAVPTVWIAIKELVEKEGYDISTIRCIPIGGSAAPRSLIEVFDKKFDATMMHAWGMTEMSPIGTLARLKSYMRDWPEDEQYAVRAKQGYPVAGVELRIVNDDGRRAAVGRTEHGRDPGARPVGAEVLLRQSRRPRIASPTTAGSARATWPSSIPRATSRSPIARRT